MTLARLELEMDSNELDLWMGLALLRNDECPNCGVEPRDLMEFEAREIKCPTCKSKYLKLMRPTMREPRVVG